VRTASTRQTTALGRRSRHPVDRAGRLVLYSCVLRLLPIGAHAPPVRPNGKKGLSTKDPRDRRSRCNSSAAASSSCSRQRTLFFSAIWKGALLPISPMPVNLIVKCARDLHCCPDSMFAAACKQRWRCRHCAWREGVARHGSTGGREGHFEAGLGAASSSCYIAPMGEDGVCKKLARKKLQMWRQSGVVKNFIQRPVARFVLCARTTTKRLSPLRMESSGRTCRSWMHARTLGIAGISGRGGVEAWIGVPRN